MAVMAADSYTLLEPLPVIPGVGGGTSMDLNTYIGYIFKFSIAIAAFLAVIMIIWGGFEIMTSEAIPVKMEGKERIKNAIIGLIMVLASYLILNTIDPRLVQINTKIDPIKIDTAEVTNFQEKLSKDLENLSKESQNKINEINLKNVELEKEKADVIGKIERGEMTEEEADTQIKQINQEIKENKANIIKESTTGQTSKMFTETMNNPDAIYLTYKNTQSSIDALTSAKVKELTALGDLEGAQKLQYQQKFFVEQLDKQGLINGSITQFNAYDLREKLAEANQQYSEMISQNGPFPENITKIKADPTLAPLYKTMLESRIARINDALGTKK